MALTYGQPTRISVGGRFLTHTKVTLDTEYVTEGYVLDFTKLGLPNANVEDAFCASAIVAKGATAYFASVNANRLQLYQVGEASKPLAEVASKADVHSYSVIVTAVGT